MSHHFISTDMSPTCLLILLLTAPIMAQIRQLQATVGRSVLINCSLPVSDQGLKWFYWQEDQSDNILFHWHPTDKTQEVAGEYRDRTEAFSTKFGSGNISISLSEVVVGDDGKTFCAYVSLKAQPPERWCDSTLQVSAPFKDLHMIVNKTTARATCTAHGAYPKPRVSWTGRNKSSGAQLDLKDARTFQQDPTEKTFSLTSSVSVKGLKNVTCHVYNTHYSNETTGKVDDDEKAEQSHPGFIVPLVVVSLVIVIVIVIGVLLPRHRKQANRNSADNVVSFQRSRDSPPNEDAAAPAAAAELLGDMGAQADEPNTSESDKDK